jgi:hypothetical protein
VLVIAHVRRHRNAHLPFPMVLYSVVLTNIISKVRKWLCFLTLNITIWCYAMLMRRPWRWQLKSCSRRTGNDLLILLARFESILKVSVRMDWPCGTRDVACSFSRPHTVGLLLMGLCEEQSLFHRLPNYFRDGAACKITPSMVWNATQVISRRGVGVGLHKV